MHYAETVQGWDLQDVIGGRWKKEGRGDLVPTNGGKLLYKSLRLG
jgi:hypothetical protein